MGTTQQSVSISELESVICSLRDVKSARVVTGKTGDIEEVHVLTDAARAPKQVVRDIESALMAKFGIELDHKKVSIAQTCDGNGVRYGECRLRFSDVSISLNGSKGEAIVRLLKDSEVFEGSATGHSTSHNQLKLISTATLRAVQNVQNSDGSFILEDVTSSVVLSGRQVVVVLVNMITPRGEDYLTGSAMVKQDLWKAVVNATLDAVNRRLGSVGEE